MDINQAIEAIKANYQIITAILAIIALMGYSIRVVQKVNKLEQAEEIYKEKLKTLEQKYETSEKIQKVELEIKRLSTETEAEKANVREHVYNIINLLSDKSSTLEKRCEKLETNIKSLENELEAHKKVHPQAYKSNID